MGQSQSAIRPVDGRLNNALRNGETATVRALLKENREWINSRDIRQRTPLYIASALGNLEMVCMFLNEYSPDVDLHLADECGRTPLHTAALHGHAHVITALAAAGANINKSNKAIGGGTAPLHLAASQGHAEAIKALIAAGANVNKVDHSILYTPLHYAARFDHVEAANALIAAKANVDNTIEGYALSPLCEAAKNGQLKVVKVLLQAGANPYNALDDSHITLTDEMRLCLNDYIESEEKKEKVDLTRQIWELPSESAPNTFSKISEKLWSFFNKEEIEPKSQSSEQQKFTSSGAPVFFQLSSNNSKIEQQQPASVSVAQTLPYDSYLQWLPHEITEVVEELLDNDLKFKQNAP